MTESSCKYYIINDTDVYPPNLSPDWLSRMITIMDKYPDIGLLTPQLPPQWLQGPMYLNEDVVYCKAVGNTLKMVRREALKIDGIQQALGKFGDDGFISEQMYLNGFKSAFCRNIFCFHAGQTDNWGYTDEQVKLDPRKSGYGKPFYYNIVDKDTFEPEKEWKI
jgi:GT2 family glycosyltransferase